MKIQKDMFQDITGIQEGPVIITDAFYLITKKKEELDNKGKVVKATHPACWLQLGMFQLDEGGNQVGEEDRKRFPVAFAGDRRPDLDWVPSQDNENPALNSEEEIGPATDPKDHTTGSYGPFLIPTNPSAKLGPFGFKRLFTNLEELGYELPDDVREMVGATAELTTEQEEDSKGTIDPTTNEVRKYNNTVFLKFTPPGAKKKAAAPAKAGAAKAGAAAAAPKGAGAAKATAKPAAAPAPAAAEAGDEVATPADNALAIVRGVVAKSAGKTMKRANFDAQLQLKVSGYKGEDKADVKALLSDPDNIEAFGEGCGYSLDDKGDLVIAAVE